MKNITFGDCLAELLAIREWSAAKLGRTLMVDSSYVRRWIRGERTPALNSGYAERMTEALCEGLDKAYREAQLIAILDFASNDQESKERDRPVHEVVQELLHRSQVYSLSLGLANGNSYRPTGKRKHTSDTDELHIRGTAESLPPTSEKFTFPTEHIPKVIQGREGILKAAIAMLKEALEDSSIEKSGELLLTFQSERDLFEGYPELRRYWYETVVQALNSGWTVKHVSRLTKNVNRSFRLVEEILDWTNYPGSYFLYHFGKYGLNNPPFEMMVVKGKGAILGFAAGNHTEIDSGIYLDGIDAVDVIAGYTGQLFANVEPLLRRLEIEEFFELNSMKDRKSGNHLLYMQDLSFLTLPLDIIKKYIQVSIVDDEIRLVHLRRIEDSLQSFYRDIGHYRMRHIYPMSIFERLVKLGRYDKNPYYYPEGEDIANHLNHMIGLLEDYDSFEIALISDSQSQLIGNTEWDIKGDHTVLIGVMPRNYDRDHVELLAITETTIVGAFQGYYEEIWERIHPLHRDKDFVISWLRDLIGFYL
ncbi:helix-turn-helix domain-containing protein [Paenibacillus crassostreae]|uniref:Uncharacterized protein n=1 Tax=Paenibacillus crassostreae TaxID=1763538 RepID=A0A162KS99_9BACL|nr:helix-turn-helix transcriptional regulator [Paenibacillus crassostreae]AOZ91793.1 hypothetical protein LPB68_05860 [Paenibacillus crassostreae]OAB73103.1 hypothetical protein PNBC_14430 [Paenibacillus crassostreae]